MKPEFSFLETGPPRFELGLTGSKPAVLPLHHGPRNEGCASGGRFLPDRSFRLEHPAPVAGSIERNPLERAFTKLSSVKEAPCADSDEPRASGSVRISAVAPTRGGSRGTPTRLQRAIAACCTLHAAPEKFGHRRPFLRGVRSVANPEVGNKFWGAAPGPSGEAPEIK